MKKIIIFILFIMNLSCEKPSYYNDETTCEFTFVDNNGIDIFSEDSPYQLSVNDFSITPFYDDHNGYNHIIYDGKNIFAIHIYQDKEHRGTNYARTLIRFGNINVDTIRVEIEKKSHLKYIKRLWYNNKELQIHTNSTYQTECMPQIVIFKPDNS